MPSLMAWTKTNNSLSKLSSMNSTTRTLIASRKRQKTRAWSWWLCREAHWPDCREACQNSVSMNWRSHSGRDWTWPNCLITSQITKLMKALSCRWRCRRDLAVLLDSWEVLWQRRVRASRQTSCLLRQRSRLHKLSGVVSSQRKRQLMTSTALKAIALRSWTLRSLCS